MTSYQRWKCLATQNPTSDRITDTNTRGKKLIQHRTLVTNSNGIVSFKCKLNHSSKTNTMQQYENDLIKKI